MSMEYRECAGGPFSVTHFGSSTLLQTVYVACVFAGQHRTICKSKNSAECMVLMDGGQKTHRSLCMFSKGGYIESATDAKQRVPCGNRPMPGRKTCHKHRSVDQWMSRPRVRQFRSSRCAKSKWILGAKRSLTKLQRSRNAVGPADGSIPAVPQPQRLRRLRKSM